ncbi:glucose 1-dehydrogenase [Candidatus Binatia bacterium]|nr:glucose 1-dehydrogenase [Candidatus Binatia bacterium]
MPTRLKDRVALITGAGSGIGRAAALRFAAEGGRVVVVDANATAGQDVAEEIRKSSGQAAFVRADVTRAAEVQAMIAFAESHFGALHVLFNNAGVFPDADGSVVDTDEAVFDQVIAVNLKGVFLGCKYGIPAILRAGGGSIVNTASFVAVLGAATSQSAYTASKGGVLALTREIAVEFARRGIRANALCPGPVNTPLLQNLLADPAARARRFVHLPMGRLAEAEEIAEAALFLASAESSYVNGTTFLVDGGTAAAYVTAE